MRVSVDSSFVFAVLKRTIDPSVSELIGADAVHVPIVVLEELSRFAPDQDASEATLARYAALQLFLEMVEVRPLTRQVALSLAALWRKAREHGARSTTVDTLAAREAVLANAVMLTCDEAMARYLTRAFGAQSVRLFRQRDEPG